MFPKFLFYHFPFPYIIYSTFSIVLIVFPVLLFQCPLFQLLHVICSYQFPVVFPIRCHHMFPILDQLFHSYFFCQMSHSQFSSLLDFFCAFFQFGVTYFTHVMYTNFQVPNFLLVYFFFASSSTCRLILS